MYMIKVDEVIEILKNRFKAKIKQEPTDMIDMKIDSRFKLSALAGLIDMKYAKDEKEMTKEELNQACIEIGKVKLPADIIVQNTVPIKDIILKDDYNPKQSYRFILFKEEDWIVREYTVVDGSLTIIGILVTYIDNNVNDGAVIFPITMFSHEECNELSLELSMSFKFWHNAIVSKGYEPHNVILYSRMITEEGLWKLNAWYCVQVSLLNPLIRFKTKEKNVIVSQKTRKGKKKSGAPKVRYFKTIYIDNEPINQFFDKKEDENGKTHYHCLMWYVTGHWRHYANGKKVFIQGYWKGEGRFSGIEAETRQRELVLDEDDLPKERVPKPKEPVKRLFVDSTYDEHVRCECGQLTGSDHLTERCDKCNTLVMYRN